MLLPSCIKEQHRNIVKDQLGAIRSRGCEADNKSCSWPRRTILRRVSFGRYLTHKAGTRAVAFVPSVLWRVETGMLQILLGAPSSAGWKPWVFPNRRIIGKALSHFYELKNAVLIICSLMIGSRNGDSTHLLDAISLDAHMLFLQ